MNAEQKAKLQSKMARATAVNLPEEGDLIRRASRHVLDVFDALPRPKALGPEFNFWTVVHDSFSGAIFRQADGSDVYCTVYCTWISAKILNFKLGTANPTGFDKANNRRFAVGIRWTEDELNGDYRQVIQERVTRAVECFTDFAEEFEEGGALPEPKIGRAFPPGRASNTATAKAS